jgi:hypothetical protein
LTNAAVVLVKLGMLGIHLVAVEIMPIADPAVSAKIYLFRFVHERFALRDFHMLNCSYD